MDDTSTIRPLALVTGASSGIGLELARVFAENGFDLVVCAEDAGIAVAAEAVAAEGGAAVRSVRADLSTADGVEELVAAVTATGRPLDALALNAGVGNGGPFLETPLEDDLRVIGLDVVVGRAPVQAAAARDGRTRRRPGAGHGVGRQPHARARTTRPTRRRRRSCCRSPRPSGTS